MANQRHIPFQLIKTPEDAQRLSEKIRRDVNAISDELSGVGETVKGAIKFEHLASIDETLQSGDIELPDNTIVKLQHGLGRKLRGWLLADVRGVTGTYYKINRLLTDGTTEADDTRDLWLEARTQGGETITVRILVY